MTLQETFEQYLAEKKNEDWHDSIEYYVGILKDLKHHLQQNPKIDYDSFNKFYQKIADSNDDFLERYLFYKSNGVGSTGQSMITKPRRKEIKQLVQNNISPLVDILLSQDSRKAFKLVGKFIGEQKWVVIFRFLRTLFPEDFTSIDENKRFRKLIRHLAQEFNIQIMGEDRFSQSKDILKHVKGGDPIWKQTFFWNLLHADPDSGQKPSDIDSSLVEGTSKEDIIKNINELIDNKIESNSKFWWHNDKEKTWGLHTFEQGKTFGLLVPKANEMDWGIGELVLLYDANDNQTVHGIFELTELSPNGAKGRYLYDFQKKPSIYELDKLQSFKKSGISSNLRTPIIELEEELFQEIISTTELGGSDQIDTQTGSTKFEGSAPKDETLREPTKDKIPFHLDQVVEEDKLGRQPVAKAFADLIKKDVFTDKLNHSFIVHLQGEWGAGKSSFMNFIKKSLNRGDEKWIIVDYNAWQNQHISPPWWTLIDQVYRKSVRDNQYNCCSALWLHILERIRRIWFYTGWQKVASFLIVALLMALIVYFKTFIVNEVINLSGAKGWLEKFGSFLKLLPALGVFIGVVYSFVNFITTPFFIKSSNEAEAFVLRAADPMSRVKQHFGKLVDTINIKGKRQLAIFIDDIDRCNKEFIVELLEGIQTLFKEKRVLFIVAGDKKWIVKSFGNTYKEFSNDENSSDQLGENFLEKAFQLSLRMPNVSSEAKEEFWNHIIGYSPDEEDEEQKEIDVESIEDLLMEQKQEVDSFIQDQELDIASPESMKKMQETLNLSADTVSNIVIEKKNKSSEDLKHLLQEFHSYIDSNPRSIIRLANNYTMIRSTLIAERNSSISEKKIFRWLIIEDLIPELSKLSFKNVELPTISECINKENDSIKKGNSIKLFNDLDGEFGGILTVEEIKIIKGN